MHNKFLPIVHLNIFIQFISLPICSRDYNYKFANGLLSTAALTWLLLTCV